MIRLYYLAQLPVRKEYSGWVWCNQVSLKRDWAFPGDQNMKHERNLKQRRSSLGGFKDREDYVVKNAGSLQKLKAAPTDNQ